MLTNYLILCVMQMNPDETQYIEIEDDFVDREKTLSYLKDELRSWKNPTKKTAIRIT